MPFLACTARGRRGSFPTDQPQGDGQAASHGPPSSRLGCRHPALQKVLPLFSFIFDNSSQGIKTVINLQEAGEHGFCGSGVGPSGFSYDPELLMANDSRCLLPAFPAIPSLLFQFPDARLQRLRAGTSPGDL